MAGSSRTDDFVKLGYHGVILTGGEPTIVEHLPDLIRYCVAQGLEPRLITNGQRLANPTYMAELHDAGLRMIHCSLHSHSPPPVPVLAYPSAGWTHGGRPGRT